jgi:tripartite-type tricarboxylate transporter receptor subunit TctC
MTMTAFAAEHGLEVEHIAYAGSAPAITALLSGEVGILFGADPQSSVPLILEGRVTALATSGDERMKRLPDVPTVGEVGFPELTAASYGGFAVPHGTPADVVRKMTDAIEAASNDRAFVERLEGTGTNSAFVPPDQFTLTLNGEADRYGAIIEQFDIQQ